MEFPRFDGDYIALLNAGPHISVSCNSAEVSKLFAYSMMQTMRLHELENRIEATYRLIHHPTDRWTDERCG